MAGLDLSGVARFVNTAILVDTVVVGRGGVGDDDVDQDTGQVTSPEPVWVGTDDQAAILRLDSTALSADVLDPDVQVILERSEARARLMLKVDSPLEVEVGDHVWATTALAPIPDPELAGYEWEVVHESAPSSFSVTRTLLLKSVAEADRWGAPPTAPG